VTARLPHVVAGVSLAALLLLCLAWELWLAPLRAGGSWMALKALPLLLPLPGVARGRLYTFQWALLLIPAYFAEGVVRAWSDRGPAAVLAGIEIALSLVFFATAICYVRMKRRPH
jgi:uncharacterized membrane protein